MLITGKRRGFTLIELMIIIVILGVLAALLSGNFVTSLKKGRDAKRKADIEQMQRAIELYYEDKRAYPAAVIAGAQLKDPVSGKIYMQRVPDDPLNNRNYGYESDPTGTYFRLYACLENNQQTLPYTAPLSMTITFNCPVNCADQAGTSVKCIWGISSSNTTP